MNSELEKILIEGLDSLEQGDALDTILARYPEQAAELRPFLDTAAQMPALASQPTVAAQQQSQANFLTTAATMREPQAAPAPFWFSLRRLLIPIASLAMILLLLGFTLVAASASALPGDGLYGFKRDIEEIRLIFATEPEQIIRLSRQFQEERLNEIEALLRAGRTADIRFEGEIEAIDTAEWIIAGLPVQIEPDTLVEGTPQIGELARVDGHTTDGRLIARHIAVLTGSPEEIPEPDIIPTEEATATPQPDMTPTSIPLPLNSLTPAPPAGGPSADDSATGNENGMDVPGEDDDDDADGTNENDDATGDNNENDSDEEPGNENDAEANSNGDEGNNGSGNEEENGDEAGDDDNNSNSSDNESDDGDSGSDDNDNDATDDGGGGDDGSDDNDNDATDDGNDNDSDSGDEDGDDGGDNNDSDTGNDGGDDSDNDADDNADDDGSNDDDNDGGGDDGRDENDNDDANDDDANDDGDENDSDPDDDDGGDDDTGDDGDENDNDDEGDDGRGDNDKGISDDGENDREEYDGDTVG